MFISSVVGPLVACIIPVTDRAGLVKNELPPKLDRIMASLFSSLLGQASSPSTATQLYCDNDSG
jgi:hypothetical protein